MSDDARGRDQRRDRHRGRGFSYTTPVSRENFWISTARIWQAAEHVRDDIGPRSCQPGLLVGVVGHTRQRERHCKSWS